MRILFLADLHGNWEATQALERGIANIPRDQTWFLGDAVGKGPSNVQTCDWVRTHCDHFAGGNWDYGIGGKEFPADGYFWETLGEERLQWLRSLPRELEITLSGRRFRVFHGRPVTDLLQGSDDNAVLEEPFQSENGAFGGVIFADSHRPFIRTLKTGYICNTGSVGNSLGVPRAHALLLEGGETEADPLLFTVLSFAYDNAKAAEVAAAEENLPHKEAYIKEVLTGVYAR